MQYNIGEAKNQFSKLVQAVLAGGDVVIARNGIPVARLVKINTPDAIRKPGAWAGLPKVEVDWAAPRANGANGVGANGVSIAIIFEKSNR